MKIRSAWMVFFLVGLFTLSGCGGMAQPDSDAEHTAPQAVSDERTVRLICDFSCGWLVDENGNDIEGVIQEHEYTLNGELTIEKLADALSELSGLDFTIDGVEFAENRMSVDWSSQSTLVAGLDDRMQKEEFHFFDAHSLNWFMLDSLWRTILANFPDGEVYYTMDGGRELALQPDFLIEVFPAELPYMGSPFYIAHADVKGDDADDPEKIGDMTEEEALDFLATSLTREISAMEANAAEGMVIALVSTGSEVIEGERCWSAALGNETAEKFTAEEHYAVSSAGTIYRMSIADGGIYVEYTPKGLAE